ncbi:MAG: ErfK/YbiS/YcfS/YnhG family protein [Hyphomonadaceae bacterium]|nr:MAG: ErfK/YbiS/YcfS/YnhG family protein [Hyphomonadaceae bacterium]KAF0182698.1 MAG: ErfK/YbiS/YcfS/YnhG family protein [Hyphomonadaceae bacterium]
MWIFTLGHLFKNIFVDYCAKNCNDYALILGFRLTNRILAVLGVFFAMVLPGQAMAARLQAKVDLSEQSVYISLDGEMLYVWAVSTGRAGFETPTGTWTAQRKHVLWLSRTYDNAPMPFAVFFTGGYAIHGTSAVGRLGRPASHGCVRVTKRNAEIFFKLVEEVGLGETQVQVVN